MPTDNAKYEKRFYEVRRRFAFKSRGQKRFDDGKTSASDGETVALRKNTSNLETKRLDVTISTDMLAAARRWRETWGYIGRGGVIVLFDGEVQSWVNELRNPDHWRPGCVAIDENGRSWTSIAGTEQLGALMWLRNELIRDEEQ